ncbi:MAG: hypothetical protein IAF02_12195 [Anaerolineae bacterium]|nr:hypothetical protein [Anaerolineae bacterium]
MKNGRLLKTRSRFTIAVSAVSKIKRPDWGELNLSFRTKTSLVEDII